MSYTYLYVHIVFSTRKRQKSLLFSRRNEIYTYISGIINNLGCHKLAINGTIDHIHIFVNLSPAICLSDFVKTIKQSSTNWIKKNGILNGFDGWQEGYFAGSVGPDGIENCKKYIYNQNIHHNGKSFEAEMEWLNLKYEVERNLKNGKNNG